MDITLPRPHTRALTLPRVRWLAWLPLLVYVGFLLSAYTFTVDDAFISLRYAQHIASGQGFVYNVGSAPSEGFTNFLLVVFEAVAFKLGGASEGTPKLIGLLVGGAFIGLLSRQRHGAWGIAAALSLATAAPFVVWTAGGLETILFAALAAGGVWAALRERTALAQLLLVFAVLARPEGMLFLVLVSIYQWRRDRRAVSGSLAVVSLYHAWRLAYFGSLLPLTFTAKDAGLGLETFIGGVNRFMSFAAFNVNALPVLAAGAVLFLRPDRRTRLLALVLFAYTGYVMSRGYVVAMDDTYRLYVPLLALVAIALVEFGPKLSRFVSRSVLLVLVVAVVLSRAGDMRLILNVDSNAGALDTQISLLDETTGLYQGQVALGQWLKLHAAPGAVVALHDAGAIAYYSGLRAIDTWSLLDPTIMRLKRAGDLDGVRAYVLALKPDYIVQDAAFFLNDPLDRAQYHYVTTFTYLPEYRSSGVWSSYTLDVWQRNP